jgi:hypothetical protein
MRPVRQLNQQLDQWLLNIDFYVSTLGSERGDDRWTLLDLTGYLAAGMWRVEGLEPEWFEEE